MRPSTGAGRTASWVLYGLGRLLQVTGLLVTAVAATAFFGTHSPTPMLRMMLVGVLIYVPGWLLARKGPGSPSSPE
ncbi:MAG TPA: hypothetical protein VFM29_01235 [Vicinamibacteria bacterium]|nr:hypothetical protein [Vicinamibacteria bacterium]